MIKKIGISLILLALLFNYNQVKAENYQIGDLVELINPYGGESQNFYIVGYNKENNTYNIISKEKMAENTTPKEIPNTTKETFEYLNKLFHDNIDEDNQKIGFKVIEGTDISACDTKNYFKNEDSTKYYFNCPEIYNNFVNSVLDLTLYKTYNISIFDYNPDTQSSLSIFEKSDLENYKYMITIFDTNSKIYNEKIINFYGSAILEEQNLNLIQKVEEYTEPETNIQENTNTIVENSANKNTQTKEDNIDNPKTSDFIIWIPLSVLFICIILTIIYVEKKYKTKKIM